MNERKLAFVYPPAVEALSYPPDCPFKTQRAGLTRQRLLSLGLLGGAGRAEVAPRQASLAELGEFHTPRYLEELERAAAGDLTIEGLRMGLGGPDTPVFADLFAYAAWACGASLTGAELLLAGTADAAFNLLGGFHHARPAQAAGFCYLNDVALACLRLAKAGRRVACVDLDAHHGDGTQEAFYDRNDVLTISLHESGKTLFPGGGFEQETGQGPGLGFNVNVPLPADTYDEAYLLAFDRIVVPLLGAFKPDVLVLELGMDGLAGDPLTHLCLTNNVHAEAIGRLLPLKRPTLVLGGGGYHVENTVRGWALAWRTFCGQEEHDPSLGLGGVLLGTTEWGAGLRDRVRPVTPEQRAAVEPEVRATIQTVIKTVFRHHGLGTASAAGGGSATGA